MYNANNGKNLQLLRAVDQKPDNQLEWHNYHTLLVLVHSHFEQFTIRILAQTPT